MSTRTLSTTPRLPWVALKRLMQTLALTRAPRRTSEGPPEDTGSDLTPKGLPGGCRWLGVYADTVNKHHRLLE